MKFMWYQPASKKHISQERVKARALKKTRWWLDQVNAGTCYYCEGNFEKEDLTMDHKVPVARGGKSTKSNIVIACKPCNFGKQSQTPVDMTLEK
ncbi:MAG: HNH endonuclease [Bdellovibrionales bacterium]